MTTHTKNNPTVLSDADVKSKLNDLDKWEKTSSGEIAKDFHFEDYSQTTSFVNAIIWLANKMDHHPDISFGYKSCTVSFKTHSANGITTKDVEAAQKIDSLLGLT